MSSRPVLVPSIVIGPNPNSNAQVVSGNMSSSITSIPTIIKMLSMVSYTFSWTGTSPVGTLSLQVSDDFSQDSSGAVSNPGTWNTLPLTVSGSSVTSVPITGNTGNGLLEGISSSYAIRAVYTAASGTGTLSATVSGKVS